MNNNLLLNSEYYDSFNHPNQYIASQFNMNEYYSQFLSQQHIYYQNYNLLTNNLLKLSEINIQQINQIKENNYQLEKDKERLKKNYQI